MRGSPELNKENRRALSRKNEKFGHYLDSYFLLAGEGRDENDTTNLVTALFGSLVHVTRPLCTPDDGKL